jgi:hypothetical protein
MVTKFTWTIENLLGITTGLSLEDHLFHKPAVQELQAVISDFLPNVGTALFERLKVRIVGDH